MARDFPSNTEEQDCAPVSTPDHEGHVEQTERAGGGTNAVHQSESAARKGDRQPTNVQVFLRMRPTPEPATLLEVRGESRNILVVRLPRRDEEGASGLVDNSRQEHTFYFDCIFPMSAPQEEVFEKAAVPVLQDLMKGITRQSREEIFPSRRCTSRILLKPEKNTLAKILRRFHSGTFTVCLSGVNGTIFAYGQTGTGKTYTITGGAECYKDRGLIPRALSYVFDKIKEDGFTQYSIAISYLEIYQEKGYDLLTTAYGDARRIEDLQKVVAREDEDGKLILRGLSINRATTEEEALHLLFLGDTNRIVAETPMNDSSTRSHCIFIIWVEARDAGASVVRHSKLHLVDLAGSERVKQTGISPGETIFKEACSINLTLHYLEQVIVALHERTEGRRVHVPYRNSMMTSVLRDSLGGNCHTVMVATITPEKDLIPETVSTCRFAQAVARIENHATVNEEVDPYLIIKKLTAENAELRDQLGLLQSSIGLGSTGEDELTEEDKKKCGEYVDAYLEAFEEDPEMQPVLGPDARKARLVFKILRDRCVEAQRALKASSAAATENRPHPPCSCTSAGSRSGHASEAAQLRAALAKLKLHIQQRDAEICILIDMLNKNGVHAAEDMAARQVTQTFSESGNTTPACGKVTGSQTFSGSHKIDAKHAPPYREASDTENYLATATVDHKGVLRANLTALADSLTDEQATALLLDRGRAFEVFRRSVRRSSISGDNKILLKDLYERAKKLGDQANCARSQVATAAARLEKIRVAQALVAVPANEKRVSDEENSIRATIEANRGEYIRCAEELKNIKADIQRLLQLNELNKRRLQQDFEAWLHYLIKSKTIHGFRFSADVGNVLAPKECTTASIPGSNPSAPHQSTPDIAARFTVSGTKAPSSRM